MKKIRVEIILVLLGIICLMTAGVMFYKDSSTISSIALETQNVPSNETTSTPEITSSPTDTPSIEPTIKPTEKPTEEPTKEPTATPEPTPSHTTYKEGSYKIGTDMPEGEYKLFAKSTLLGFSYFEVTKDSSGELSSIISNDNFYNFTYITVYEGQYLNFSDAIAIPSDEAPVYEIVDGKYISGMYKVGVDIPAGEYKVISDSDSYGYFERNSNSEHSLYRIIANDNFENNKYVTINEGEYFTLSNAYINVE